MVTITFHCLHCGSDALVRDGQEVSELRTRPGKLMESGENPFQNARSGGQ
jgi:hypothetical protein